MSSKHPGRAKRVFIGIVITVIVLAVIVRIAVPPIAVAVANSQLAGRLKPEAGVKDLDIALLRGRARLQGLYIQQPEGYGPGPLLDAPDIRFDVGVASLFGPRPTVQNVEINNLSLHLVRDTNGVMNVAAMMAGQTDPGPAEPPPAESEPSEAKPFLLHHLAVNDLTFTYTDLAADGEPLEVIVTNLDLVIDSLVIDTAGKDEDMMGSALLTATIRQAPLPDAQLGLAARIGPVGVDVPALNAVLRLVGLELAAFDPVVPTGVAGTLGGDSLDLDVDLQMAPDVLKCDITVTTAGNTLSMPITGTPSMPIFDRNAALSAVAGRFTSGLGNMASSVSKAGVEVADAALGTTVAVGKGAGRAVSSLGKGIFGTLKGAASGDVDAMAKGIRTGTVGTVSDLAGTVTNAMDEATEGVRHAASTTTGSTARDEWRSAAQDRWGDGWPAARETLKAMPYPVPETTE